MPERLIEYTGHSAKLSILPPFGTFGTFGSSRASVEYLYVVAEISMIDIRYLP